MCGGPRTNRVTRLRLLLPTWAILLLASVHLGDVAASRVWALLLAQKDNDEDEKAKTAPKMANISGVLGDWNASNMPAPDTLMKIIRCSGLFSWISCAKLNICSSCMGSGVN